MLDLRTISMTLGRKPMLCNAYSTPYPRAIDDTNLRTTSPLLNPSLTQPQAGISLTTFFIEAIKLSELTDQVIKGLYAKGSASHRISALGRGENKEDSFGSFDILLDLETKWNRLSGGLSPELRWPGIEISSCDPPRIMTTEPTMRSRRLERQTNVLHTR